MSDAPRYHHGALASALIDAAMTRANGGGLEHLSLRALARDLNVSHPAVYRHFASKAALLRAVADRGFVELDQSLAACVQPVHRERFEALGCAYVDYAVTHPGVYRAMFRRETYDAGNGLALPPSSQAPFARVAITVGQLLVAHRRDDLDPRLMTLTAWSVMHGMATLWIDGAMESQSGAPDAASLAAPMAALVTNLVCGPTDA